MLPSGGRGELKNPTDVKDHRLDRHHGIVADLAVDHDRLWPTRGIAEEIGFRTNARHTGRG